jgi:alkylhydroperoxidase/carboxymuconolactone decarboxylase family protein YurZ
VHLVDVPGAPGSERAPPHDQKQKAWVTDPLGPDDNGVLFLGEDGTLSVKVKEFVVMGILASRGLQYGVEAHMRRALAHGATKDELFEAVKAAAVV